MRKITNPFANHDGFYCFGCSPANEIGLKLEFFEEGDYIVSEWKPRDQLMGYNHVLHGGIQSTLLDEIASWTVYIKAETAGVTSCMNVTFHKPVHTNHGKISLRCRLISRERKKAVLHAELMDHKGNVCSSANIEYFIYPEEVARRRLNYPGKDSFF